MIVVTGQLTAMTAKLTAMIAQLTVMVSISRTIGRLSQSVVVERQCFGGTLSRRKEIARSFTFPVKRCLVNAWPSLNPPTVADIVMFKLVKGINTLHRVYGLERVTVRALNLKIAILKQAIDLFSHSFSSVHLNLSFSQSISLLP